MAVIQTSTPKESNWSVRWTRIVPALFVMLIVGQMGKNSVGITVAFKPFLDYMNLAGKPAEIGLLMTAYLVAFGVGQFLWGFVLDRWGARRSAVTGVVIWTIVLILTGLATSLTELFVLRIAFGLAIALLWPVPNTYTAKWFPQQERGRANMIWISAIYFGVAVAGLLLTVVMKMGGWRWAFFTLAFLSAALVLPVIYRTPNAPQDSPGLSDAEREFITQGLAQPTAIAPGTTRGQVLGNYRYWLVTLTFVINSMMFWGLSTWFPSYIGAQHESILAVGSILTVTFLVAAIFVLLAGTWSDRVLHRAPVAVISFAGFTVLVGIGLLFHSSGLWGVALVGLAGAFAASGTFSSWAMLHSLVHGSVVGFSAGFMSGLSNIIAAFAPFIMGVLIGAHANYFAGFGFLAAASLVAALVSIPLMRQGI